MTAAHDRVACRVGASQHGWASQRARGGAAVVVRVDVGGRGLISS